MVGDLYGSIIKESYGKVQKMPKMPTVQKVQKMPKVSTYKSSKPIVGFKKPTEIKKVTHVPGTIKGSIDYKTNRPGIFVKSIKGMEGKHFIEKALTRTMSYYQADMKE